MTRLLIVLLLAAPGTPPPDPFHYHRQISAPSALTACLQIPPSLYTHTAPGLTDLRLYAGQTHQEIPYVLTISQSAQTPPDPATLLSQTAPATHLIQTLQMPARLYTEVDLNIPAENFTAVARISGLQTPNDPHPIPLTPATLFDLSAQHLSRDTSILLQEIAYPYLRVDLTSSTPLTIASATVPASREAQTLYTTVAQTSTFTQHGRDILAKLNLPARIPVERVSFAVAAGSNFSRLIQLTASAPHATPEGITGEITRVHLSDPAIKLDRLSVPATLAANLQQPAEIEVAIQNGDQPAIPVTAIRVEMRQRNLCFTPPPGNPALTLSYGDASLPAPAYAYSRSFDSTQPAATATLGPEQINASYVPRTPAQRPFFRRHPELPWLALLLSFGVMATLALRATHPYHRS